MTVTASGEVLTPLVVFKGKPGGRIAQREFATYPHEMDEKVMLTWVDTILKPYVMTAPDGVVPIVFWSSYRCHMMSSVVEAVQDLGVEVEHIPGGCTGLCQPVDVGVNKPFKHRIRHQWERWMIAEGLVHGTTSPPSRLDICRWTLVAFQKLPEQMIRNAWRHGEYTWFPGSTREEYPQPTEGLLLAMSGKEIEEHKTTPQARDNCARTDLKDLPSLS
ncbi:pogo transposable element with KRAB domain [Fragilaria crotonensis]|nr:pogo transposable element with KRAB domain [Fragilaria crotonensis]